MKTKLTILLVVVFSLTTTAQTWTNYTTTDGLIDNSVYAITIDNQGNKWVGTNNGVSKFDGTGWTSYTTSNSGLATDRVNAIAIDDQGNKWFGTWGGGVSKFDGINWTSYLPYSIVTSICLDSHGNLWFGTNGGISEFDGTNWKTFNTNYLATSFVQSIGIEVSGIIWVGTEFGGVSKFDGTNWTAFTKANSGLLNDNITCIVIDKQGNKWFVTGGSLSKYDDVTWTSYNIFGLNAITIDDSGNIWGAGTGTECVSKYDLSNWSTFNNPVGISDQFLSICIDNQGIKWLGSYSYGVFKFEDITTGINKQFSESNKGDRLTTYPNPAVGETNLLLPSPDRYSLIISDLNGRKIQQLTEITGEKALIKTEAMASGVYILSLRSLTNGDSYRGKIVVLK